MAPLLEQFTVDTGNESFSFISRLERENGWSNTYALKAFKEYKKFMYLCSISDEQLTPSDQVDQVWHTHLVYTKSYWNEFCPKVLKQKIHHNPTTGGKDQRDLYKNNYQKTLSIYTEIYKLPPPKNVWPDCETRFKSDVNAVRIHRTKYKVVSKHFFHFIYLLMFIGFVSCFFTYSNLVFFSVLFTPVILLVFTPHSINYTPKKLNKDGGCGCDVGCSGCSGCGGDGCGGCGD